jgi:hypothetical protein
MRPRRHPDAMTSTMTTATPVERDRLGRAERVLLWLEALLAIGAYAGGVALIVGGIDLGESAADLPFGAVLGELPHWTDALQRYLQAKGHA